MSRLFRRLRRHCWKLLVWFVIASAVVVSIGRLIAPYADAFRPVVERFLSDALNQPVRIERIAASWPRLSPQITMYGLEVGGPERRLLDVDRARLEFKLYNVIRPKRNSFELIVLGLNLVLVQDEQGRWSWRLDRGGRFADGWEQTVSAGDILLRDSGVRIAPHGLSHMNWSVPEARLSRSADLLRVRMDALPEGGAEDLLEARFELHMPDSRLEAISGFARSPNIALSRIAFDTAAEGISELRAQMQWWLRWNRADGARFHGRVDLHSLALDGIAGRMSSRFELDGAWQDDELLVELNARELGRDDGDEILIDRLAYGNRDGRHGWVADSINLDYLHALTQPWLGFFRFWPERLSGTLSDVRLGFDADGSLFAADGFFAGIQVALKDPDTAFSIERMGMSLAGDRLQLWPAGAASVHLPDLYHDALEFNSVAGTADLLSGRVDLAGLSLEHAEFSLIVDGIVELQDQQPFLDLVVEVPRLSPDSPQRWLPARGIGPNTRKWLEEALLELDSARAVTTLFGNPLGWRDHVPDGAVNSDIVFSGLRLAYARNWPIAEQLSGSVEFSGESMLGRVDSGTVLGVGLSAPRVRIAETRNAEIELSLAAMETRADELARLASGLPLGDLDAAFERLSWRGPTGAEARIWLPVKHRDDWRLVGSILFQNADLTVREQGISLAGIAGELPFTRERLGPARLAGRMHDQAVEVALDGWVKPRFRLALRGVLPVLALVPADWRDGMGIVLERIGGNADFAIDFAAPAAASPTNPSGTSDAMEMRVASALEGVALDLPLPLAKPAGARWPFELVVPFGDDPRPVRFEIGERFTGRWLMQSDYWQLGLGLGVDRVDLPVAENFIVEGQLDALEIDKWLALLAGFSTSGLRPAPDGAGPGLTGWMNVVVDDLRVQETSLGRVELALNREDDYWRLKSSGQRVDGSLRFPASGTADRSLVADMARFRWPVSEHDSTRPPAGPGPPSDLDPRRLPALDISIRQFEWGGLDLGEFRLNSHRVGRGLQIEQFSSGREGFEVTGSGDWLWLDGMPQSRMRVRLATADLGRMLTEAGFDLAVQRGQAVIELDGAWPGSPLDLSLQRVDGGLDLVVTDGVIPEASPGAGRLLGLVSLNSIPRRLRLDFSDVFGDGLSFDRLAGHFDLSGGAATTEDMRIDAPAAEVRMRGRTDLENRTYDQTLIVRPGVGSALPIIGALAGGPVGAAAGAALQQLFSRPLGGISEVRYSVTGSWQNPVIEPVAVEPITTDGG